MPVYHPSRVCEDEDAVLSQLSVSNVNICLHHGCLSSGVFVKLVFSRFPATHHQACLGPSWFRNGAQCISLAAFLRSSFAETSRILQICGDLKMEKPEADIFSVFFGLLVCFFFLSNWQPIML